MLPFSTERNASTLGDRLRDASSATPALLRAVIATACRSFPSLGQSEKSARVERLIDANAWSEAALALIELELPHWQLRRIAYDGGEWYCALSRERELPEWLDESIEARHADLPLALLIAFVEAQGVSKPSPRASVPAVQHQVDQLSMPLSCDNFA